MEPLGYILISIAFTAIGYALGYEHRKRKPDLKYWENKSTGDYRHLENNHYWYCCIKDDKYLVEDEYLFTEDQLKEANLRAIRELK